ncbi:hypothetical protein OROHE_001266 [Orobanche hederae]
MQQAEKLATSRNINSEEGLTICLFLEHGCPEMSHSIYMIRPSLDSSEEYLIDSQGFMVAESESISPVLTFQKRGKDSFITESAMFHLGSRIYFFGGRIYSEFPELDISYTDEFKVAVRVLDTDHPEQGLRPVASMYAPKQTPCVFAAPDGMIYALGSALGKTEKIIPGCKGTGCFERYDPNSDKWEVLPDPPLPLLEQVDATWCDCATVVDHYVFIGNPSVLVIFNLDTQEWDPLPPLRLAEHYPYGSLYVDGSLYYLRGQGIWKPGTILDLQSEKCPRHGRLTIELVKRGPLRIPNEEGPSRLLTSQCLRPENAQVMATKGELDEGTFFTDHNFRPWREVFHLGGHFFCYVVTAQIFHENDFTIYEPYCRGIWIKVFEEVRAENDIKKTEFRPLASFCYKIRTPFRNDADFVRCCAFGNIPDWVRKNQSEVKQDHGGGAVGNRGEISECLNFDFRAGLYKVVGVVVEGDGEGSHWIRVVIPRKKTSQICRTKAQMSLSGIYD